MTITGWLDTLPRLRAYRSKRCSSFDRSGGNVDFIRQQPGTTLTLAEIPGAGCIKHIWMTLGTEEPAFPRRLVLRAWWDGETAPSIEVPIGDFFGLGHGLIKNFVSGPLQMSPEDGRAWNCFFPMPFATGARLTLTSECDKEVLVYFYIDYEEYDRLDDGLGRFHAQWRRENPTDGWAEDRGYTREEFVKDIWSPHGPWSVKNTSGEGNYVILEASGRGHYVGCHLDIDCFQRQINDWYGEGDDMIFIDGEAWPPSLHGTGTEDYFNTAFGPKTEYCAPCHGILLYSGTPDWPWQGKNSVYRYHLESPIAFTRSIRVTIEHGHANKLSNDYASTAYWYQEEPHAAFPLLPPLAQRLPR
jgi:hypothetical protein